MSADAPDTSALTIREAQDQVDHWLSYSSEMTALEGETLAAVIETEVILTRLQGLVL